MNKEGVAAIVLRFARTVLLTDLALAALIGLACYLLNWHTLEAYRTGVVWTGVAIIVVAWFTGVGGFASRGQEAVAFTRFGAGSRFENLQRITDARSSNLGCLLYLMFTGLGLIAISYLVPVLPLLF